MDAGDVLALVLCAAIGAAGFRIRGGYLTDRWPVPGQVQRLTYSALMAGIMVCSGYPWPVDGWRLALLALSFVGAWFLGAIAFPTFHSIDAGRIDGDARVEFWLNAARGALYCAPAAAALAIFRATYGDHVGAWAAALMPLCGSLQGGAYEASWRLWPMSRGGKPTEVAELFSGACFGLGAAAAALA